MAGYILVKEATLEIQSLFTWNGEKIPEDYPIPEGSFILEAEDSVFNQVAERFPLVTGMKIKDRNALDYTGLIEELGERDFAKEQEVIELKAYLASTDFYFIRQLDSGKPIPQDVQEKRDQVRQRMTELGL